MKKEFTEKELETIYFALSMHKCYIETGSVLLSAKDAKDRGMKVCALSVEQMKKVIELNEIMLKVLS